MSDLSPTVMAMILHRAGDLIAEHGQEALRVAKDLAASSPSGEQGRTAKNSISDPTGTTALKPDRLSAEARAFLDHWRFLVDDVRTIEHEIDFFRPRTHQEAAAIQSSQLIRRSTVSECCEIHCHDEAVRKGRCEPCAKYVSRKPGEPVPQSVIQQRAVTRSVQHVDPKTGAVA